MPCRQTKTGSAPPRRAWHTLDPGPTSQYPMPGAPYENITLTGRSSGLRGAGSIRPTPAKLPTAAVTGHRRSRVRPRLLIRAAGARKHPRFTNNGSRAGTSDHSGGSAVDLHHLPFSFRNAETCNRAPIHLSDAPYPTIVSRQCKRCYLRSRGRAPGCATPGIVGRAFSCLSKRTAPPVRSPDPLQVSGRRIVVNAPAL